MHRSNYIGPAIALTQDGRRKCVGCQRKGGKLTGLVFIRKRKIEREVWFCSGCAIHWGEELGKEARRRSHRV